MRTVCWLLVMALPLAGCGSSAPVPGPVTADETQALDQAAEMLDSRPSEAASGATAT